MIKIYNSLTRQKEDFKVINDKEVKIYVCGPTVYDQPHIGHARSAYIFDVIKRYLEYRGYKVKFVRNVTDVDDKIIDKAKKEFPNEDLNTSFKKVATKYLDSYHAALKSLGIDSSDIIEPKASDYINKMINFIEQLIEKKAAYEANGDVYFDITKAKDYGKLSNQSLDKMEAGARVAVGENKRNPLDFALWKKAKPDEPSWPSLWGNGRPGWHIECSAMSSDILGNVFDIHGGGLDLIFPHHENELAQSEGAGKEFARYWIHHGLLTINGQKMAKSLGNFITIEDFINKYKDTDILKLFFLSTHYSHPIDYSQEKIDEAKKQKQVFDDFFDRVNNWTLKEGKSKQESKTEDIKKIDELCLKLDISMDDDFNMPKALASIFELVDFGSKLVSQDKSDAFLLLKNKLVKFFGIFGLTIKQKKEFSSVVAKEIRERESAKKNNDFKKADAIRKDIEVKFGGTLIDTPNGITFIGG